MVALNDTTVGAIEFTLRGLNSRAEVSADNIANLNTPGFRAGRVDFRSTLDDVLRTGELPANGSGVSIEPGGGLPDASGNTVDLETEMVGMMTEPPFAQPQRRAAE